ncbi:hypothetical protein DFH09DRAFT_832067, partial [Mycena vulgaris]
PKNMLKTLTDTASIISGSLAILPFIDGDFTPNDLDIYVLEEHEVTILRTLEATFGYTIDRTLSSSYTSIGLIIRFHWLQNGGKIINLMVIKGVDAVEAIYQFHSTVVMNFISGTGAYCAYPELTLKKLAFPN